MESSKIKSILIGTTNETKYLLYKKLLSFLEGRNVELKKLTREEAKNVKISETLDNIEANAIMKAVSYAKESGQFTIADDTAFFIPALNNEPGIAVRRWGGLLPENITDQEWEKFFLDRLNQSRISEPNCIKQQVIAFSDPEGNCRVIEQQLNGKIKIPGAGHYVSGGPLSSYFFLNQCQRFEADLTEEDKMILLGELRIKIIDVILQWGGI